MPREKSSITENHNVCLWKLLWEFVAARILTYPCVSGGAQTGLQQPCVAAHGVLALPRGRSHNLGVAERRDGALVHAVCEFD